MTYSLRKSDANGRTHLSPVYLLRRHHVAWDNLLLWLLAGGDHSTRCTITVLWATSTAAAKYDGNDDGQDDNRAYNSSAAPNTVWQTNSPTTILSDVTLVVGRTETRGRTTVAFAITAFLARSTLVVVRTGTRRPTTDAFAFIVFLPQPTLEVVRTGTRRETPDKCPITALLVRSTLDIWYYRIASSIQISSHTKNAVCRA